VLLDTWDENLVVICTYIQTDRQTGRHRRRHIPGWRKHSVAR